MIHHDLRRNRSTTPESRTTPKDRIKDEAKMELSGYAEWIEMKNKSK
jgi:hypothetical protein